MKKMLKRIIVSCYIFLFAFMSTTATAYASEDAQNEYYVYNFGEREIRYQLDEKRQPYYESNGERIYVALPLEHLKITDEALLAELNLGMQNDVVRSTSVYEPPEYHDLAVQPFERTMYLNDNYKYTDIMKMDPTKSIIRIKTSEEIKNTLFTGKKISYLFAYYSVVDEAWYRLTVEDSDCSNNVGDPFDLSSGQLIPYVYYGVKKSSDLYSAKVTCWCTDV